MKDKKCTITAIRNNWNFLQSSRRSTNIGNFLENDNIRGLSGYRTSFDSITPRNKFSN